MERHSRQPEELNASAKIAPCGWGPVADRDQVFVPESSRYGRSDRPTGTPQYYVGKRPKWEPKSVASEFNWKHGMA